MKGLLVRHNTGFRIAEGGLSDSNFIEANHIRNGGICQVGDSSKVRRNDGVFVTGAYGVSTTTADVRSITVNHGCNATPNVVVLTGRNAETADT